MNRVLNLVFAVLVALAPGMSAVRLAHSLEFCMFAPAPVVESHSVCGHSHDAPSEPDRHDPQDCPHLQGLPQIAGAMNVAAPVPFDLPPPPLALPAQIEYTAPGRGFDPAAPERPPTGPPLVGCVLLRI